MKGSNNKGDINYYKKYMKYKNKYLTHLHNINQQTKSSNIMIGGCPGCMNPNCAACFEETLCLDNNDPGCIKCKKCQAYSRNFNQIQHNPDCNNAEVRRMMGGCVGCLHPDCIICYEETRTNNHELVIRCKRCHAYSRNLDEIQHTRDCDNAQVRILSEVWSEHHLPEPERDQHIVSEHQPHLPSLSEHHSDLPPMLITPPPDNVWEHRPHLPRLSELPDLPPLFRTPPDDVSELKSNDDVQEQSNDNLQYIYDRLRESEEQSDIVNDAIDTVTRERDELPEDRAGLTKMHLDLSNQVSEMRARLSELEDRLSELQDDEDHLQSDQEELQDEL